MGFQFLHNAVIKIGSILYIFIHVHILKWYASGKKVKVYSLETKKISYMHDIWSKLSFPSLWVAIVGWLIICFCLSQTTPYVFCTARSLNPWCGQRGADHLVPECMCAMLIYVLKVERMLRPAMTTSPVSKPNFGSFVSCLGIAINKKLINRANAELIYKKSLLI